jgi:hypothetical protein
MKKLFTNLVLIILVKGFISAAPSSSAKPCKTSVLVKSALQTEMVRNVEISEIHPLDILNLKFK